MIRDIRTDPDSKLVLKLSVSPSSGIHLTDPFCVASSSRRTTSFRLVSWGMGALQGGRAQPRPQGRKGPSQVGRVRPERAARRAVLRDAVVVNGRLGECQRLGALCQGRPVIMLEAGIGTERRREVSRLAAVQQGPRPNGMIPEVEHGINCGVE